MLHKIPASANHITRSETTENIFWFAAVIASILCLEETLVHENLITAVSSGFGYLLFGGIAIAHHSGIEQKLHEFEKGQ